jgi:tetratricopeptide (TPR) repeat protein
MKSAALPTLLFAILGLSCGESVDRPSVVTIQELNLKRGPIIFCSPGTGAFGKLSFDISGSEKAKADFNLGLKLLHSFEYDEAEKAFAKIIDEDPGCAMAYWGVAMANFHPLWSPPSEAELKKGNKAVKAGQSINRKSKKEGEYIGAIASFYEDWDKLDHATRCGRFEKGMAQLHANYPEDREATIFYALALDATAAPTDKSYQKQLKAGALLQALYPEEPEHPGIIHYIIHTYDYPGLAEKALPAARRYAQVAPSSAHALHMPSHIFTRLGLWQECIASNRASVTSAQCYASAAGIKGHWDEEIHGLDYLMYAFLQQGANDSAKNLLAYVNSIEEVHPDNAKVAYSFAAMPCRFALENRNWRAAADLQVHAPGIDWDAFPWPQAMIHFTRLIGRVHIDNLPGAQFELEKLKNLHETLLQQKDAYKADQVLVQVKAGEAWILLKSGKTEEAIRMMQSAADKEDSTGKSPVTPGEVLPARELLGDMYAALNRWDEALLAYQADLKDRPHRFNGLYGAGRAAEKSGKRQEAAEYYRQLLNVAAGDLDRPELSTAKRFLK